MRIRAAVFSLLLALTLSSEARADLVLIDFDFSGSTISALGGLIVIPPSGTINSASGTMRFSADGTTGLVGPGQVNLTGLTLDVDVNAVLGSPPVATITGMVTGNQVAFANGTLSAALGQAVFGGNMFLSLDVLLNCTPTVICGGLGFPISIMGLQTLSNLGTIAVQSINNFGNAAVTATLSITLGGNAAQLQLVGVEVQRTYVPEPGSAALFGMGILGVAGYGWRRRLRRG